MSIESKIETVRKVMETPHVKRWRSADDVSCRASIPEMSEFAEHAHRGLESYEQFMLKEHQDIDDEGLYDVLELSRALRLMESEIGELDQEREKDYREAVRYLVYFMSSRRGIFKDSVVSKFLSGKISG